MKWNQPVVRCCLEQYNSKKNKQDPGFMVPAHIPRGTWEDREKAALLDRARKEGGG